MFYRYKDLFIMSNELLLHWLQELGADVNLYALVFGESVLNDAVCAIFPKTSFHYILHFNSSPDSKCCLSDGVHCYRSRFLYTGSQSPSLLYVTSSFSELGFLEDRFVSSIAQNHDKYWAQSCCKSQYNFSRMGLPWSFCGLLNYRYAFATSMYTTYYHI
jgi:hypothetical protein